MHARVLIFFEKKGLAASPFFFFYVYIVTKKFFDSSKCSYLLLKYIQMFFNLLLIDLMLQLIVSRVFDCRS